MRQRLWHAYCKVRMPCFESLKPPMTCLPILNGLLPYTIQPLSLNHTPCQPFVSGNGQFLSPPLAVGGLGWQSNSTVTLRHVSMGFLWGHYKGGKLLVTPFPPAHSTPLLPCSLVTIVCAFEPSLFYRAPDNVKRVTRNLYTQRRKKCNPSTNLVSQMSARHSHRHSRVEPKAARPRGPTWAGRAYKIS